MFDDHDDTHPADEDWDVPTRPPTGIGFVGAFEGRALITLEIDKQPCWFAAEVAAILELGSGASELARRLAIDWADEAREGVHWVRTGELELAELQLELCDRGVVLPASLHEARSALLILEPGLALAVARTTTRDGAGQRLLTHVRERVIPEIQAITSGRTQARTQLEREAAAIARDRLELERRRWEYDALEGLCEALEHGPAESGEAVDAEVVWAYRVVAAEIALDGDLWQLKPNIEHGWLSPSEIARRHLGVTPQRVGQVISLLGLRESKVHAKAVLNKAIGRDRTVVSHLYSPAAVGLIERELRSRGYRRVE